MEISFFKIPKHKKFTYNPLYYNQEREELQDRIKRIEREEKSGKNDNYTSGSIKGSFQHLRSLRSRSQRSSSVRVIIIALILLAVVYFIFGM